MPAATVPSSPAPHERTTLPGGARPWLLVPLLYFLQGVPYVIVNTYSVLMYNKMGVPNAQVALWTSIVAFAWTLKMFWGPLVDSSLTKRRWVVATQLAIAVVLALVIPALALPSFLAVTLGLFAVVAFCSATHDIAADGFYLLALNERQQAFFVGVRSTFYRLANIFGTGFLVWLAGQMLVASPESNFARLRDLGSAVLPDPTARAWGVALFIGVAVYAVLALVNAVVMPFPSGDRPRAANGDAIPWAQAFATFFSQRRILWILGFILFYRFGESMIGKLSGPFLQDPVSKGGLGVPTAQIGVISGTIGVLALTLGGILGGFVISKWGIKKCLWPMVLSLNVPNLFYVWAAFAKPGVGAVTALIAVDQFGYGFGFSAYMVYLMFVAQGSRFETSHYAIATGLMALGALLAGSISGYLQGALGYSWFFVVVCLCTIPGMITLFFIPLDKEDIFQAPVEID